MRPVLGTTVGSYQRNLHYPNRKRARLARYKGALGVAGSEDTAHLGLTSRSVLAIVRAASRLGRGGSMVKVDRRGFLRVAAGAAATLPIARRASAQAQPPITYWDGLTRADGTVLDE